jgi:hypothetical protein
MSEDLDERMAIVDCAMSVVEIPDVGQEITELGSAEAVLAPVDLGLGAGPVLMLEDWRQPLRKLPVKGGVMGDDDVGIGDERFQGGRYRAGARRLFRS